MERETLECVANWSAEPTAAPATLIYSAMAVRADPSQEKARARARVGEGVILQEGEEIDALLTQLRSKRLLYHRTGPQAEMMLIMMKRKKKKKFARRLESACPQQPISVPP